MVDAVADQNDSKRKHYGNADLTDVLICATRMSEFSERVVELPTTMLRLDAFRALNLGAVDCLAVLEQAHVRVSELRTALGE